jgi:hypothetical protein
MELPVDEPEPGVYRVALAVVCNQEKQEAKDKLIASILASKVSLHQPVSALARDTDSLMSFHQVNRGIIADVQCFFDEELPDDRSLNRLLSNLLHWA